MSESFSSWIILIAGALGATWLLWSAVPELSERGRPGRAADALHRMHVAEAVARIPMALGMIGLLASVVSLIIWYNAQFAAVLALAIFLCAGWCIVWTIVVLAFATARHLRSRRASI